MFVSKDVELRIGGLRGRHKELWLYVCARWGKDANKPEPTSYNDIIVQFGITKSAAKSLADYLYHEDIIKEVPGQYGVFVPHYARISAQEPKIDPDVIFSKHFAKPVAPAKEPILGYEAAKTVVYETLNSHDTELLNSSDILEQVTNRLVRERRVTANAIQNEVRDMVDAVLLKEKGSIVHYRPWNRGTFVQYQTVENFKKIEPTLKKKRRF